MGVVLDTSRELERQDFTGVDTTLLVSPKSQIAAWVTDEDFIEFPWEIG